MLILVENIFPPIPSEVILLFSGFMLHFSNLNLFLMILFSTLASTVGAILLYYVGHLFSDTRLKKLANSKIGKFLHLKFENVGSANSNFNKTGRKSVFLFRFVPIMRSLISIPAGKNKMPLGEFLVLTFIGSAIWNTVLIELGNIFGESWPVISVIFAKYSKIVKVIIILLLLVYIYKKIRKKKN
jgi:membrane protein DedA with SNARE-associated domain